MSQNPERSEEAVNCKTLKLSGNMVVIQLNGKGEAIYDEKNFPLPDVAVHDVNKHGEDKQQTKKG